MNLITRKLRSKTGASMLIAMVFMLFCLFVGGSVLAAATANGSRVAHMVEQQVYLDQRSSAMLISDELQSGSSHQLIVHDVTQVVQRITVGNGGVTTPVGDPVTYHTITFQAPSGLEMTPLQRVMYETTVWRYLEEHDIDLNNATNLTIQVKDFTYQDGTEITSIQGSGSSGFWFPTSTTNGQITIRGTNGSTQFASFYAYYESDDNDGLYDFLVSFGEDSQLKVIMHAFTGTRTPVERVNKGQWTSGGGTPYDAEITTISQQFVISWDAPLIEKGGA